MNYQKINWQFFFLYSLNAFFVKTFKGIITFIVGFHKSGKRRDGSLASLHSHYMIYLRKNGGGGSRAKNSKAKK